MKYYLDVTKYNNDNISLRTEKIPMDTIDLGRIINSDGLICYEYYHKKMLGKNKAISSLIYNGNSFQKDDVTLFRTCCDDIFSISDLDTDINDLVSLINGVKECDGIYAYFNKSISKEVKIKYLVPSKEKEYNICEESGILRLVDSFGNVLIDDKYIDFNSVYSIHGEDINYVNPFIMNPKMDYQKYFCLIEESVFSEEKPHTLKRKK